ncbi:hypothetical protein GOQ04_15820 [Emticicia sp. ODNR4P]|nr:hypothetical protein [Emticicia sp. ODNR4P]
MKTHLSFLALLCMLLFTSTHNLVAQCTIPLLDIKDSVTIKALRRYVDKADVSNSKGTGKYIDTKSTVILLQEEIVHQADRTVTKLLKVNMARMNYYKYRKMSILGYFYIDEFLVLVTSSEFGLFATQNYDYDNCLSQVLQNHSLREYDAPKRIKKIFHNQEVEQIELGERTTFHAATITLDFADKKKKEPFLIQFEWENVSDGR